MEIQTKSGLRLVIAFLLVFCLWVSGTSQGSHEYPKVGNIFPGGAKLEHCPLLSKWDLLVLNCNLSYLNPELVATLRSLNPEITILTYFPVGGIWAPYGSIGRIGQGYGDKIAESDWWLYDDKGNRIGSEDYTWFANITTQCIEDEFGQTIQEWLADYIADEIVSTGVWDGVFLDVCFSNAHWLNNVDWFFAAPPGSVDANRDGVADHPDSLNAWWGAGLELFLSMLRQRIGDSNILVGNGKNWMSQYLNGGMREGFPNEPGGWEEGMLGSHGYLTMCEDWLQYPMNSTMMTCWWKHEENTLYEPYRTGSYEKFLRFTLTSALLGDGYYILNGGTSYLWWEDYYDLHLGSPTSEAYLDSIWNEMYGCVSPIWRRDFENAAVYCNPFDQHVVFEDGTWITPRDGRITIFDVPCCLDVMIEGSRSQRRFNQNDMAIGYEITLANQSENAVQAYVWANLTSGDDTLVAGRQVEYLVGAADTTSKNRFMRVSRDLPPGTYCLEVLTGGRGYVTVSRDTILVTKVIDFRKRQVKDGNNTEESNLVVHPQPISSTDGSMRMEVTGNSNSSRLCSVKIFDVSGRLVRNVSEGELSEGNSLQINLGLQGGEPLVPGVYFVTVQHGDEILSKKIVLLR